MTSHPCDTPPGHTGHDLCANRTAAEQACRCPCHSVKAQRAAASALREIASAMDARASGDELAWHATERYQP